MNERGIRRIQSVNLKQNSPIHQNGYVLEPGNWKEYDPFLMLMEDVFQKGAFDFHPHRGIETVTYVIDGTLEHEDNQAGKGKLEAGDVQWMTAGRGVIHKEDPAPGSTVHSLQLWINLPKIKKMTEPRYQNLKRESVPVRKEEGAVIRVFSGSSQGVKAKTLNHVPITMVEIDLEPKASIVQDLPGSYNGFLYVLEGSGFFGVDETEGRAGQVLFLTRDNEDSDSIIKITAKEKMRVLLYAGEPINEPVVAYGPFVMTTQEEIRQAILDFQNGKFHQQ
ncbi:MULTISPECIES: pirin family protein [Bacillus]|jgi:redox-sensitive bicupin YhaK (pirin superfamily)|uniref:pirin family protein n=1 Tax=Bacillus TaxID=1386 RepID=UPI002E1EF601|nr:pirin family protein [Bacillus smithii]MED1457249.1 pirin family protein [Bacillus smithii]MED1490604.1 pirin family protein [Bacillus smithii]